ncbi:MAG: hypothetical protein ABI548_12600 [Polyangiaceae bacterium]
MPDDQFFFDWQGGALSAARAAASPAAAHYRTPSFEPLRAELERHSPTNPSALAQPYFQRTEPCTLVLNEVERLWSAIAEQDDWVPFEQKVADIRELGAIAQL